MKDIKDVREFISCAQTERFVRTQTKQHASHTCASYDKCHEAARVGFSSKTVTSSIVCLSEKIISDAQHVCALSPTALQKSCVSGWCVISSRRKRPLVLQMSQDQGAASVLDSRMPARSRQHQRSSAAALQRHFMPRTMHPPHSRHRHDVPHH